MNAAPPKIPRPNYKWAWVLPVSGVLGAVIFIFFFNPATHRFYPVCYFHQLTGLNCPGCGMTRALYALLHGDLLVAWRDNALFILAIFLLAGRAAWFALNHHLGNGNGRFLPMKFLVPLLALALVFAVLRNLPGFGFLSPA